jgi:ribosomal protein S18
LKITQADNFTLGLWALINDSIKDATSPGLDCTQAELVKSQKERLSERAFSEKGPLNSKIDKCGNSDDELISNKNHSDRGAAHYFDENWLSPAPPMVPTSGGATHKDTRLSKLEFEIRPQKLTNELRELKRMSEVGKSNSSKVHQVQLERAVRRARGTG